jgi:beta-glucosidase-like glycosyl hydrolase
MNLIEKVNVTTGVGWANDLCVGNTGPALNVEFPSICLQDGPLGIRFADHITAFPAGLTVAATWNRDLMYRRGQAHAKEARLKGVHVLLGPSMGPMGRMPAGGRNWEGFGVDPVLQAVAASETIKGIQDEGVQATAKHLIAQEQEHFRQQYEWGIPHAISSNVDDRTLHEIYLWPFAESVRVGVASIMCSYNQVNNSYACGNSKLMNGILKDELGFQGYVQSDWLAKRSGVGSALAGLDMDMPGDGMIWGDANSLWGGKLTQAVLNTSLPLERLDDMVTRIVAAWYQLGQDKWAKPPPLGDGGPNFSSWTNDKVGLLHNASGEGPTAVVNKFIDVQGIGKEFHGRLAKEIAVEGNVLVKNEGNTLPLSRKGSVDLPKGLKYNVGIFGEDAGEGEGPNACIDRACNQGTLGSGWGSGELSSFSFLL